MKTDEMADLLLAGVQEAVTRATDRVREELRAEFAAQLAALPTPEKGERGDDGTSVDPAVVKSMVEDAVLVAISALPVPKNGEDGKSVTVEEVAPVIADEVARAVSQLPPAKDGIGIIGATLVEGRLVLEFSDGTDRDVGPVVGKDGEDADPGEIELVVRRLFDDLPKPKNGEPGRDGVGTMEEVTRIARESVAIAVPEEVARQVAEAVKDLPRMEYRDIWKPDVHYTKGNTVTFGGGMWVCKVSGTPEKPGTGEEWRLAVKPGRNGKDAK